VSLRVLIVDDEPPARRKLRAHLSAEADVEVVGEASDGLEAVQAIRRLTPELVFLDVQMPGMDGFEVLAAVGPEVMPAVIFATAYDEYAVKAFEVEAVDYLLKPFDAPRFQRAFGRARKALEEARGILEGQSLARLLRNVEASRPLRRIVVSERDRVFFVPLDQITHLSSESNYVRLHTRAGSHLVRDTMAHLESRLDADRFARIHRTGIVALDAIVELRPGMHGDHEVVLDTGERLRLSRRYRDRLLPSS
jgi:two-component system LytT family response regulator